MSHDRFEYAGMVVTAFATAVCAVAAVSYALKAVGRARFESARRRGETPQAGRGRWRRWADPVLPWLGAVPALAFLAVLALSLAYQYDAFAGTDAPRWNPPPPQGEVARTAEWRAWRDEVHDILSAEPVTEQALSRALRVRRPGLPDGHTEAEALRRDQAIADVLLTYEGVKNILSDRFGIRKDFLGTGLSKPLGATAYSSASVHEYLVENHSDSHEHVWLWKITQFGGKFSLPLETLIAGEKDRIPPDKTKKAFHTFDDELKEILLRVKNKEHPFPPMIRFARFDQKFYKETLGRPNAYRVFTSNLTEVWDLTIQQAAEKSGYTYKDGGDTLFIWVYLPYHSDEFTPATWRQVLARMPEWLDRHSAP